MKIVFTRHAIVRCVIRKISEEEIIDAVKYPDAVSKRHGKYFHLKRLERGTIEIVIERTENHLNIITLYWV